MIFVRQLLAQKGEQVISVAPDTSLQEAIRIMADHDIGVVVVVNLGKIVGIFSERDFTRALSFNNNLDLNTPVSELMTENVISVSPTATIDDCMVLMTGNNIRHLPVTDNETMVGLISIRDVLKELLAERDSTIRGLENYIMGTDYNR